MNSKLKTSIGVQIVNTICTLNCKRCITKTPYHVNPANYKFEDLSNEIEAFFNIYESVDHFDLEGGETLLHPDLDKIIQKALSYKHLYKTLNILTNGTIVPSESVMAACKDEPVFFIIDDYGDLSFNKDQVIQTLEANKIDYRIDTYYGEDQYYGGWIDFGDMTFKNYSNEELCRVFENCRSGKCGAPYIKNGKMYLCPVQATSSADIELLHGEYVDLVDPNVTMEERIEVAKKFGLNPINSCKYCKGFNVNSERQPAAEQLKKEELTETIKYVLN